jgi:hypothetical protein
MGPRGVSKFLVPASLYHPADIQPKKQGQLKGGRQIAALFLYLPPGISNLFIC